MVSTQIDWAPDTTGALPAQGPVAPSSRIEGIDVLRGLALFGVLAINIVFEFRVSIFEQFLPPAGTIPAIDRALSDVLAAAIELKALALFSFLFGVGLAIQFDRLINNPRRLTLLIRRLVVLLGIGAAHLFLLWNGDILVEYAMAGLVVLPFLFGPRWLTLLVAAASLVLFLTMPLLPPVVQFPSHFWIFEHIAEATRAYGDGGFLDVLAFRVREIPAFFPLHVLIFPRTIALFLFGVLAWRSGILQRASEHKSLLFSIAMGGVLFGGALTVVAQERDLFGWPSLGRAHEVMVERRLGGVVLAAGYAASIVGLASVPAGQRMLAWAAPVGRMALTNYLGQSLILGWIFYGYGFGLFGKLSVSTAFTIGVVVYAMQAAISAWWLGRYRYGPVEWLWRSLMYGSWQQMVQT
jgi:uncharacterized protein